ncbi:hypothetical protein DL767_008972 [Monosporascus sp. MG133]|nr:hypothetical protein DL767_008972 [Monosporascus sp. MG133]
MGSSQPPDGNLPFGIVQIPDSQDFPFFDAPAPDPPQGPPVLSSDDSGRLDDFFQGFDSNHYNFSFGEGLNFSDAWLSDLPPTFMGTATSLGQQHLQLEHMSSPGQGMPATSIPDTFGYGQAMIPPSQQHMVQPYHRPSSQTPLDASAQADVAAVLAALQTGHHSSQPLRNNGMGNRTGPPLHHVHHHIENMRSFPRHQVKADQKRTPVPPTPPVEPDNLFRNPMFAGPSGSNMQRMGETPGLQWGSDSSFARPQGFVPTSRNDTHEALEQERINYLKCLQLNRSAATTRPSSPTGNGASGSGEVRDGDPDGHIEEDNPPAASPPKRRKSRPKEEAEEDGDTLSPTPPKPAAKKRKSKAHAHEPAESSTPTLTTRDASGKRRKSGASGSKAPRENLSEAQKRENHIKSEQKRRGAIKEGYQELCQIVPNLSSSGYSKSMMLTMAADWLEDLIRGNEELAKR